MNGHKTQRWGITIPRKFIIVFFLLSAGFTLIGYFYYENLINQEKKERQNELATIGELKVEAITDWLKERKGDAVVAFENPVIGRRFLEFQQNPSDRQLQAEIQKWMDSRVANYQYKSIFFVSVDGKVETSSGAGKDDLGNPARTLIKKAVQTRQIIYSDLYRIDSTRIYFDALIPVFTLLNHSKNPIGVLVYRMDPSDFLYPSIQTWPVPSRTSEILLVRKEENEIIFLNELRHRKNTALKFWFPLTHPNLPASMAVQGKEGIVEGVDYRGKPVLAWLRKIPDTSWFFVAKTDLEEIYEPVRRQALQIGLLIILLNLSAGAILGFLWRNQRAVFYHRLYELEQTRQVLAKHYDYMTKYANDIILLSDDNGNIVDANERALHVYGYPREELLRINLNTLHSPEVKIPISERFHQVENHNGLVYESINRRKDGTTFPVETSSRMIEIEGKKFYQSIIRDISERKQAENKILKLSRTYQVLSEINQMIVHVRDRNKLITEIGRVAVDIGKFGMAWIQMEADDKIEGLSSSLKPHICNDIENSNLRGRWREKGLAQGYRSFAAFPIQIHQRHAGSFILYSTEVNFFDEDEIKLLEEVVMDISYALEMMEQEEKRRSAEKRLKDSEERYRGLFEHMLDGFAYCKMIYEQNRPQDFIYLEVNSAFERLTGLKNVVGRKVTEVIPGIKESNPELFEIYSRVALTGKPERLEIYLEPLKAWLSISVYSGEKEYFVAVFDNITERKRIEDELKQSREWFSTVFEATRDGIVVEEDEKIAYANLSFAKLFRYDSPGELVGKPISVLHSAMDNDRLLEYGRKRLKGETVPSQYEFTGKRKDGSLAELEASISIATISGKKYIISSIRNISERKQTEEQLRKLFRAVEFSPSSIVITDVEGRIEYVNPKFTRVTGYAPAEVIGKNSRILKSGETSSEEYKKLWETILAGNEWSGEFHNKRKNGELFWESASISPISDLDGKVTHFIAVKEDITEKKHLQQIAKRMEQLAALGQLSASIAHEIRNPLAAISLNIQMLSDRLQIPDDYREMVDDINIGIQRIQNIIKDILNFARPVQPTLTTEDIQKVIENCLHSVINDMEKGQITVIREYEPIPIKVKIDTNQITEVLINLFTNARQAMSLGGKLTVRTRMQNHNVIVEVEDTGGGISPQNLEKVFSPFFTTKPRGTGLGLAIVYRIVENHHAQIFVESKEGAGTRFRLQFPLS